MNGNIVSFMGSSYPTNSGLLSHEVARLFVDGYINAISWNASGSRLAALSDFGSQITIWECREWRKLREFKRYGGAYSQNSFSYLKDGTLLTSSPVGNSPDPRYNTLSIFSLIQWDVETGQPIKYIPDLGSLPTSLHNLVGTTNVFTVSDDGELVAGITGRSVLLFRVNDWVIIRRLLVPPTHTHPDFAASVAISPSSHAIAVGTGFGYVHLFQKDETTPSRSFTAFSEGFDPLCGALAFSPDGRFLAAGRGFISVGSHDDGWTRVWQVSDFSNGSRLVGGSGSVRTLAWSPDAGIIAVGDDRSLTLWRATSLPPKIIATIRTNEPCYSLAFSPSGQLAYSSGNEIRVLK